LDASETGSALRRRLGARAGLSALLLTAAVVIPGCGRSNANATTGGPLRAVAAENVWGNLAAQLGGQRAQVASVISSPAADPHDYEPTAADARLLAGAELVIVNGIGYDPWASKLLAANPVAGRIVLDVGALLGIDAGENPHRWYSPSDVRRVVAAITRDYSKLDPQDARYFARRRSQLEEVGLREYRGLLASIAKRFRGVRVGASESIFEPLAQALGLRLLTPSSFLRAISEGTEPTAADRTTIDRQIAQRQIAVWIYNRQNSTPDVVRITDAARRRGIPVVTVTETLVPASTFQQWQSRQLQALSSALADATGR
jgi:zinc/manganese transport system substrate-binding protein